MSEHYQWTTGREEPRWSFREAKLKAQSLRAAAGFWTPKPEELIEAAIMIEDLAHAADIYRHWWVGALREIDAMRNTPRDAEKPRNDEAK